MSSTGDALVKLSLGGFLTGIFMRGTEGRMRDDARRPPPMSKEESLDKTEGAGVLRPPGGCCRGAGVLLPPCPGKGVVRPACGVGVARPPCRGPVGSDTDGCRRGAEEEEEEDDDASEGPASSTRMFLSDVSLLMPTTLLMPSGLGSCGAGWGWDWGAGAGAGRGGSLASSRLLMYIWTVKSSGLLYLGSDRTLATELRLARLASLA